MPNRLLSRERMARVVDAFEIGAAAAVKLRETSLTTAEVVAGFNSAASAIAADAELGDAVGDFWTELENERARRR